MKQFVTSSWPEKNSKKICSLIFNVGVSLVPKRGVYFGGIGWLYYLGEGHKSWKSYMKPISE